MEQGLIHIYTGKGKGKTTAALGLALRALGYKKKVYLLQFLKGRQTGERLAARKLEGFTFCQANKSDKFLFQMEDLEKKQAKQEIEKAWEQVCQLALDSDYEMIILDEIMIALANNLITLDSVEELMENKAPDKELILTGRNAPDTLIRRADYVTRMQMVKHPYQQKVPARRGIEY